MPPSTLLVGMGNPILRDDAVGVRLAREIARRLGPVPGLGVLEECSVGGLGLLDVVKGFERVVVLDSIKAGGPPGHWYRFGGAALRPTMNLRNVHDVNFATALELGRRLGVRVPADSDVHVFAVEVLDNTTFDAQMTAPVEACLAGCAEEIAREIAQLLTVPPRRRLKRPGDPVHVTK
ncbi:MAG: hydrogenase maturation protease [Myxococcales bacterium]